MGPEQIIEQAGAQNGWIAALFALLVLGGFSLFGVLIRQIWIDLRETRKFQQDTLMELVSSNRELVSSNRETMQEVNVSLREFTAVFRSAPCVNASQQS